jgi:hypothetical protein
VKLRTGDPRSDVCQINSPAAPRAKERQGGVDWLSRPCFVLPLITIETFGLIVTSWSWGSRLKMLPDVVLMLQAVQCRLFAEGVSASH